MNVFKITILMPVYNNGKHLPQAVDSILSQKTNYKYKLIFLDDCSDDSYTAKVLNRYTQKYPDKIFLQKNRKNLGLLKNIIGGYKLLDTSYFAVLDPDDYWTDQFKIQNALDFLEKNLDFSVYTTNYYLQINNKRKLAINKEKNYIFSINTPHKIVFGHTSSTIFRNTIFQYSSLAFYKNILNRNSDVYRGDSFRNYLHLENKKGFFNRKPTSVYRINSLGIWNSLSEIEKNLFNAELYLEMFIFFKKRHKFFWDLSLYFALKHATSMKNNKKISNLQLKNWRLIVARIIKNKSDFKNNTLSPQEKLHNSFLFYYPSKKIGGYQYFFFRLAKYLSEVMNFKVYYVDYEDGFVKKNLGDKSKICFINFLDNKSEFAVDIGEPVNLILPVTMGSETPKLRSGDSKIVFCCSHPKSALWLSSRSNSDEGTVKNFLKFIAKNNSLFFTDRACFDGLRQATSIKFQKNYIQIFTEEKKLKYKTQNLIDKRTINIAWLGRLDSDKIFALSNLLENLYQLKTNFRKCIHIIGDGDSKHLIDVKKFSKEINIKWLNSMIEGDLHSYLVKNTDLVFGMGTSALEVASLRLPSAITMMSSNHFSTNRFFWLFNTKEYVLGLDIEQKKRLQIKFSSFKEIIDDIYLKNKKASIANSCFNFYKENFVIEDTVYKLLPFIYNSSLRYEDYKEENIFEMKTVKQKTEPRIKTRLKLIAYSLFLIINQIPLLNKFFISREGMKDGIIKTIKNDK